MSASIDPWVSQHAHHVLTQETVLDLACGRGRHTRFFLNRGCSVTAVDVNASALEQLPKHPQLNTLHVDLENQPWPFVHQQFDAIIVTNYLWRPLLSNIMQAVAKNGHLIYATYAQGQAQYGRPKNPNFLLKPEELRQAIAGQLVELDYFHGLVTVNGQKAMRQGIVAKSL